MDVSLTQALANYAASTSIDKIPDQVRDRAKQIILDEMASAYFGHRRPAGALGAKYAARYVGRPEALILGSDLRVPAAFAALANGTAGHADEIDGAHVIGGHPGASLVHATVAIAETQHSTGAELLNAVILAYDMGTRFIEACGGLFGMKNRLHLHSDSLHALGAALACGRLLGLDESRLRHALALATFQANGVCSLFSERRHISKAFCNGQYAFAGVSAALMAADGLEGSDDVLGHEHGVLDAWGVDGGSAALTRGLGESYAVMGANFKYMRAGYPIHAAVEAAMDVVARHEVKIEHIQAVMVGMPEHAMRVVDNRAMHNICVQDMLTTALLEGGLDLGKSYFPEILAVPEFAPLRERVSLAVDPELDRKQPNGRGARVTIVTTAGESVSSLVEAPRGHSSRGGTTWPELTAKWEQALPGADVRRMLALAQRLDDLDDVCELTEAFQHTE
ncbi:MmgE/PrpD family protein [Arthrobacter bambusae]|uniref:MmgE/PrpD family protein n=1 Tax=Arthrobacter bambusae TaxID=1338426 RepID=UPI001F50EDC1|nr:MmgE/PrpD family protein [Arthrobacter bambusae]MCI0143000.1 MmgE/PrpD family protein [Arthrobacter bambusae]